jgi:hypothetical protein
MKTRTLILLALACGLAILVAGGVMLVNLARNRTTVTTLAIGESTGVGTYQAAVVAADRRSDAIVLTVRVTASTTPLSDAAAPWSLKVGDSIRSSVDPASGLPAPACAGASVAAGASFDCALAFAPKAGTAYAEFSADGDNGLWVVPA